MKVYPRQPLEAERTTEAVQPPRMVVYLAGNPSAFAVLTDAEFAAAFMPADQLDAVLDAARAVLALIDKGKP